MLAATRCACSCSCCSWHGAGFMSEPDWSGEAAATQIPGANYVGFMVRGTKQQAVYVGFNPNPEPCAAILPNPGLRMQWRRLVDTARWGVATTHGVAYTNDWASGVWLRVVGSWQCLWSVLFALLPLPCFGGGVVFNRCLSLTPCRVSMDGYAVASCPCQGIARSCILTCHQQCVLLPALPRCFCLLVAGPLPRMLHWTMESCWRLSTS